LIVSARVSLSPPLSPIQSLELERYILWLWGEFVQAISYTTMSPSLLSVSGNHETTWKRTSTAHRGSRPRHMSTMQSRVIVHTNELDSNGTGHYRFITVCIS
jgi:hypothetical protein